MYIKRPTTIYRGVSLRAYFSSLVDCVIGRYNSLSVKGLWTIYGKLWVSSIPLARSHVNEPCVVFFAFYCRHIFHAMFLASTESRKVEPPTASYPVFDGKNRFERFCRRPAKDRRPGTSHYPRWIKSYPKIVFYILRENHLWLCFHWILDLAS
jgi:hypothetical protein